MPSAVVLHPGDGVGRGQVAQVHFDVAEPDLTKIARGNRDSLQSRCRRHPVRLERFPDIVVVGIQVDEVNVTACGYPGPNAIDGRVDVHRPPIEHRLAVILYAVQVQVIVFPGPDERQRHVAEVDLRLLPGCQGHGSAGVGGGAEPTGLQRFLSVGTSCRSQTAPHSIASRVRGLTRAQLGPGAAVQAIQPHRPPGQRLLDAILDAVGIVVAELVHDNQQCPSSQVLVADATTSPVCGVPSTITCWSAAPGSLVKRVPAGSMYEKRAVMCAVPIAGRRGHDREAGPSIRRRWSPAKSLSVPKSVCRVTAWLATGAPCCVTTTVRS